MQDFSPKNFLWKLDGKVATITLNRPEKKNPLTFESYAELRDTFQSLGSAEDVRVVVICGAGGNFCSGGDVHEIIEPLTKMELNQLHEFTRMTGALQAAILGCPQVVISAIDGVCAGAGACIAMASDLRFGSDASKVAFLFVKVGLAGCDMGACNILPRIIGQGRAAELLYTGRSVGFEEAYQIGFLNRVFPKDNLMQESLKFAQEIAQGPTSAHIMTKRMLAREWSMNPLEALEVEAEAQAQCMLTKDFKRAYDAFSKKEKPVFRGN